MPSGTLRVGIITNFFAVKSLACSAAKMMFLLFGKIITFLAGTFSTACTMSSALGFIVWPPSIISSTAKSLKRFASPLPGATATMPISLVSTGCWRLAKSSRFSSRIFSIFKLSSSPSSRAYASARFGSFVCTCTFTSCRSPIQITLSPMVISFSRSLSISAVVVFLLRWIITYSVQYPNLISPKLWISGRTSSIVFAGATGSSSISSISSPISPL